MYAIVDEKKFDLQREKGGMMEFHIHRNKLIQFKRTLHFIFLPAEKIRLIIKMAMYSVPDFV